MIRVLSAGATSSVARGRSSARPGRHPRPGLRPCRRPGLRPLARVHAGGEAAHGEPGWLQAGRSLDGTEAALARLRRQLLLGLPLMLVLAGVGGLFLAGRALAPIDHMAAAAEQITGSDLSGRMGPQGSEELGRLAGRLRPHARAARQGLPAGAAFRLRRVPRAAHAAHRSPRSHRGDSHPPAQPLEYEDTLRTLETEVARLTRLSEDLLLLARFDRGALTPRMEQVDLSGLLASVAEQVRPLAEARRQVLAEDIEADLGLRADSDQLIRLFLNLLDNAVKFTGDGGPDRPDRQAERRLRHGRGERRRCGDRPRAPGQHLRPLLPRRGSGRGPPADTAWVSPSPARSPARTAAPYP